MKEACGNSLNSKWNGISEGVIYDSVEAANISSSTTVLFIKLSQVSPVALRSIFDRISQSKRWKENIESCLHRVSCKIDELCKDRTFLPYDMVVLV